MTPGRKHLRSAAFATFVSIGTFSGSFVQEGPKFVASNILGRGTFGTSVALSADGNTAVVGGAADNSNRGAAWILTRTAGVWAQGPKLIGSGAIDLSQQGSSVAISADGNTVIVGGAWDDNFIGAAWVWTRSGSAWTQQAKLVGSGTVGFDNQQGFSVALSSDGNTAAVGGWRDNTRTGAVWIWTRSGSAWSQQGSKLVGSGATGPAQQGYSVSLSADGSTLIVGGNDDSNSRGAAWVWTRSDGVWTQQGPKLVGAGGVGGLQRQANSVSISADGNTALVGGPFDNSVGAVWVWTRSAGVWSQQGSKLVGTDTVGSANLGWAVSISADGNTAVAGGFGDDAYRGAVWVWVRSGGTWTQLGTKRVGANAIGWQFGNARQGQTVSISGDATTFIEGTGTDNDLKGAVWMFVASASSEAGPFFKVGPVNNSTSQSISPTISWTISSGATGYEYCYQTLNLATCSDWIPHSNVLSAHLVGLQPATTYYWHVRATGLNGSPTYADVTSEALWSFTTKTNVIQNGSFSSGTLASWQTFATPNQNYIVAQVLAGAVYFYRVPPPPGESNQAVVLQNTGVPLASGEAIEARFNLANTSSARKRISILLHDGDFSDLSVCTFWLEPNWQMVSYGMRSHTTKSWTNATISFYAATAGSDGGHYQLDNVVVVHGPPQATDRTECVDPTTPAATGSAPGPELLANGGFDIGLTAWSTFGAIDQQVNAGVLEFRRPPPGEPAGVVLQPTSTAINSAAIITAAFELGNSSAVRKRVTVLLHDLDFTDLSACTFWLAPGQPLSPYTMRTFTTKPWTNATISIYAATIGFESWIRVDNVSLRQTPGSAATGTECLETGGAAPSPVALDFHRVLSARPSMPAHRSGGGPVEPSLWLRRYENP